MRKQRGDLYTFVFATIICLFCSIVLALAATALRPAQQTNARLDIVENLLSVVGYEMPALKKMKAADVLGLFKKDFRPLILNARDQEIQRKDLEDALVSGLNYPPAEVAELFTFELLETFQSKKALLAKRAGKSEKDFDPGYKILYEYQKDGKTEAYIVPIQGNGLWDRMYGYIALEKDLRTVRGITFYEHKETPGLGGEVDKTWFKEQFKGKTIFSTDGRFVSITIAKGKAADRGIKGDELTHYVDGISGASLTGKGVNVFLKADLEKFVPLFKKLQATEPAKEAPKEGQGGKAASRSNLRNTIRTVASGGVTR